LSEVVGRDHVLLLSDPTPLAKVGDSWALCRLDVLQVATNTDDAIANINPLWAAPEVLAHKEYGKPADVYALGMMVMRGAPFHPTPITLVKSMVSARRSPNTHRNATRGWFDGAGRRSREFVLALTR
jgi:serine/threonine protein kinase